ncbi:uncharacterized protein LOC144884393 [Branchiostoma floridae x Branchiostoma japonicum]
MPANSSSSSEATKMEDSGSPVRVKRRKPGPPPTFSPSVRKQRRRDAAKTRVRLLDTFGEWRSLQKKLHLKTDRDLARTLLDRYPCVDVGSQSTHKTLPSVDIGSQSTHKTPSTVDINSQSTQKTLPSVDVANQSTHKTHPCVDVDSQSTHKTLPSVDVDSQSTHKTLPSVDIGSQSTHKTLLLKRGLLCTWNNIMASRGFSDDMEFLWFLLTTVAEMSGLGLPAVRSNTNAMQGIAHKTTQKRTNSRNCVPVKVDYVGPSRMTTGTSHTENPEPAVPTLTYRHPSRTKNSNSAAIGPVASNIHVSVPEEEHYLHPNNGLSDTDTASEFELHSEGIHVKEEDKLETDLGSRANTSTSQPSFVATDHDSTDEQEMHVGNHDTTSPHQTSPVSSDTVDELETDLHTSQLSFGADVKEEDESVMTLHDNNQVTSQLCTGGPDVDGEDEQEMDDGNSGDTSATFVCGTDDTEAEEENILGHENILEESEVESASSEDDEKGHQSDDSWHPPSEKRKTVKNSKESSKRKTNSTELTRETERESRPKKTWVCECEETFESQSLLYKHKEAVHPKFCEICDKRFPTTTALNKCRRSHMSSEDRANLGPQDGLAFCALCRGFFSKRRPKRHFQVPQNGQQRPDRCQESITYRDGDFVGGKPVIKKRRKQRKLGDSVSEKRRRMSKDVPCTWEGCQKTFKWNAEMRAHLVHHTGERSHLCSYCGQMFLRNDHLTVHMRIHTGDMPFKCSLCNYSGRQSNCLRWHMKTHHPEHCQQAGSGKGAQPTREEDVLGTSEMLNDLMDDGETSPSGDYKGVEPTGDVRKEENVLGTSEMPNDSMEDGENSPSGDYKGVEPTGDVGKEEDVLGTSEIPDDLMDDGETSPSGDYKGVEPTGNMGKEEDVLGTSEIPDDLMDVGETSPSGDYKGVEPTGDVGKEENVLGTSEMPDDSMEDGENSPSGDYKGAEPIKDMDTEEQVLETFEKPE